MSATSSPELQNSELESAIADARRRYVDRNPASLAAHAAACAVMPGGNTRTIIYNDPFPLRVVGGEGCRLRDADGHSYVDLLGEYAAGLFGHTNPVIRSAIEGALAGGVSLSGHNLLEFELATELCRRFPSLDLVRFTNSGTEANLMALATAIVATGRRKVLVFEGGYHGAVLSFPVGGNRTNVPHEFVFGAYNDIDDVRRVTAEHGEELAAILVEPMIGAGGCLPADPAFLKFLRAEATRIGAVLIFDEVITSRAAPGGFQTELGIIPDMTVLGKYIGGGLSFGAFGGARAIMDHLDPARPGAIQHGGTFNNNILSMAAGLAGMTKVLTPLATRALAERGDALRKRLNGLAEVQGVGMCVTGAGSLMTVHFSRSPVRVPADVAAADQALKELFFFDMIERGQWIARRAMLALSLDIGDAEADGFFDAVADFVSVRGPILRQRLPS